MGGGQTVPHSKQIEMDTHELLPLFPLGIITITPEAQDLLTPQIMRDLLNRHWHGDWGEMTDEDKQENDFSVPRHLRIFSAYTVGEGDRVWIITEADRSSTTILLPGDY